MSTPPPNMTDRLKRIEEDVADLKQWTQQHDEEHTADTRLLASILDSQKTHEHNHHGRASTIRRGSIVGAAITLLYIAAEVIRTLLL